MAEAMQYQRLPQNSDDERAEARLVNRKSRKPAERDTRGGADPRDEDEQTSQRHGQAQRRWRLEREAQQQEATRLGRLRCKSPQQQADLKEEEEEEEEEGKEGPETDNSGPETAGAEKGMRRGLQPVRHERLASPPRTELAYNTHREVVSDVKAFVASPVPLELGTLQCSLCNFEVAQPGLFGGVEEVWELRITDPRIKYEGLARFTNVNNTRGTGGGLDGPSLQELSRNRLAMVAERKSQGFIGQKASYVISMAECAAYHGRASHKTTHLVGTLEQTDSTSFCGYDLYRGVPARGGILPRRRESVAVRYHIRRGMARQIRAVVPLAPEDPAGTGASPEQQEQQGPEHHHPGNFWENDVAPEMDSSAGVEVLPEPRTEGPLASLVDTFAPQEAHFVHSRMPVYDPDVHAYILDFGGRVTEASTKNFQLDLTRSCREVSVRHSPDEQLEEQLFGPCQDAPRRPPTVQFGLCSDEFARAQTYSLDVTYPLSVLQALQLALSALEVRK